MLVQRIRDFRQPCRICSSNSDEAKASGALNVSSEGAGNGTRGGVRSPKPGMDRAAIAALPLGSFVSRNQLSGGTLSGSVF